MHQVTFVNEFTPYSSQNQIQILKICGMRAGYIIQSVYGKYICRSLGIPLPLPHHRNPRESVAHRVGSTGPDVFHQRGTSHVLTVEL